MNTSDALRLAILLSAVKLSKSKGLMLVRRIDIALAAGSAEGTVSYHFKSMARLRETIVAHAIEHDIPEIVAQAPEALKRKAARLLAA